MADNIDNTFIYRLAKRTFMKPAFQKSWQAHMNAFGPILGPAFPEDYPSLIKLTNALNKIAQRDIRPALELLREIRDSCRTDSDNAMWCFAMGLAFEMGNAPEQMLGFYRKAAEFGHEFHLPYLKSARVEHTKGDFEAAEADYIKGIALLEKNCGGEQKSLMLAAAWSNVCSCRTMMHRYAEAEEALCKSIREKETLPGREANAAVLYCALKDEPKTEESLKKLRDYNEAAAEQTQKFINEIRSGNEAQFCEIYISPEAVSAFWKGFSSAEADIRKQLEAGGNMEMRLYLRERLAEFFPFVNRNIGVELKPEGKRIYVFFADYFSAALMHGYSELFAAKPESLSGWVFASKHYIS